MNTPWSIQNGNSSIHSSAPCFDGENVDRPLTTTRPRTRRHRPRRLRDQAGRDVSVQPQAARSVAVQLAAVAQRLAGRQLLHFGLEVACGSPWKAGLVLES